MLRDLPPRARWYIIAVIALGAVTFGLLLPRATLTPVLPLLLLVALSALTSAFKMQLPIAGGSSMSASYVVNIASLILRGPHATMIVGAVSGLSQSTLNSREGNPPHRTLFNIACLILRVQVAGQVYQRLGGTPNAELATVGVPLVGMALTYFFASTIPIAIAVALTMKRSAWRVWRTDFAPSAPSYGLGAAAVVVAIAVTESAGYWLTLLLAAAPLYLTYKVYRAASETEARQGAILEAAHDAIVTMDQQLNIREFNPAAERMFGIGRDNVLGQNVGLLLPAADRPTLLSALTEYQRTGEGRLAGRQLEMSGLRADGAEFPAEVTVARVGGDSPGVITGFIRDITQRRAFEERIRQSQKLEAIGRLAGGVAHDFNNILMSILGSADLMLMQSPLDDQVRDETLEIKQSVRRGAGLTRQLLAFSRRQAASPKRFALDEVINGMETMLRRLIGPEIDFTVLHGETPTMVVADPAQIEQVVLNLVVNARDAMPDGGRLTVNVEQVDLDEAVAISQLEGRAGHYARLTVSDTGTGIDAQTRARLFEPFFTTKEHGQGTGLGLSIVYGIVRQSGGYITVVSEPGQGAAFVIDLPIAAAAEPSGAPLGDRPTAESRRENTAARLARPRQTIESSDY